MLFASGADRWLNCPPSIKLSEDIKTKSSFYANEGTLAHELAEICLKDFLGEFKDKEIVEDRLFDIYDDDLYTPEMTIQVGKYIDYIKERISFARRYGDSSFYVEKKLDFLHVVPNSRNCVLDFISIYGNTLEVIDLKYGKGVKVSAVDNPQLKLYGLAALKFYSLLYDFDTVKLTIVQPRLDSLSTIEMSVEDLETWSEEIKPIAQMALNGEGELKAGSWCTFCPVKPVCKKRGEMALEAAKIDFKDKKKYTDKEIIELFSKVKLIEDWTKSLKEYILTQAIEGKSWPGYKLVQGISKRKWTDTDEVADILSKLGFKTQQIYNIKLKGLGDIGNLMSKDKFHKNLDKLIIKPPGAPTLTSLEDPRPALGNEQAKIDFAE